MCFGFFDIEKTNTAVLFLPDQQPGHSSSTQVVQLINSAQETTAEAEKVSLLSQAQEFIIHRDLLDVFTDDILAFQSDRGAEVRKFVAGFIEAACKKDPAYFPRVIGNLKLLLADEVANVLKKTIQVSSVLYKLFLTWLASHSEPSEEVASTLLIWKQVKSYISTLIDSTDNDGIRTQCIKFIENVILCQTNRDSFTTATPNDVSLDQIAGKNSLIEAESLETEATVFFAQLVAFQGKIHISSVNLMATMQSLSLIARQRSAQFFTKVVSALETLNSNLPPTLAKIQVNSVNKQMKLLLLTLFKHPYIYATKQHGKLMQLLLAVGATQSEVNRCLNDVRKRGIKIESTSEEPARKRTKLQAKDSQTEATTSGETSAEGDDGTSKTSPFNVENALQELSRKFSRNDANKAAEITAKDLLVRLTDNPNTLADLVLSSINLFPETLTDGVRKTLSETAKIGQAAVIPEIAKRLSMQFTAAGLGKFGIFDLFGF